MGNIKLNAKTKQVIEQLCQLYPGFAKLSNKFYTLINIPYPQPGNGKNEKQALGRSKIKGWPELPKDFEWPEGHYFLAQFNCTELAKYDMLDLVPTEGMYYIFENPNAQDFSPYSRTTARFYYNKGQDQALESTILPKKQLPDAGKYHYEDYVESEDILEELELSFHFVGYEEKEEQLPMDLISDLKGELGISFGNLGYATLFGQPQLNYEEGWQDLFTKQVDLDDSGIMPGKDLVLFFQIATDSGQMHYWIEREAFKTPGVHEVVTTFSPS